MKYHWRFPDVGQSTAFSNYARYIHPTNKTEWVTETEVVMEDPDSNIRERARIHGGELMGMFS